MTTAAALRAKADKTQRRGMESLRQQSAIRKTARSSARRSNTATHIVAAIIGGST